MKKLALYVAIASLGITGNAFAAPTANVDINATVTGTCQFNTLATADVNLILDPAAGGTVNGSGSVEWWCTKTTPGAVQVQAGAHDLAGAHRMLSGTTSEFIAYAAALTGTTSTVSGAGKSSPYTTDVDVSVAEAAYVDVTPAADYTDVLTIEFTP